jgi:hypothetical protein
MKEIYKSNKNMSRPSTESERMNIETAKSPAWQFRAPTTTTTEKNKRSD